MKHNVRKFLGVGIAYVFLVVLAHLYFSDQNFQNSERHRRAAQLEEKFNSLVFQVFVPGNELEFPADWKTKVEDLKSDLDRFPELKQVKLQLEVLDRRVMNQGGSGFNDPALHVLFRKISDHLSRFAQETAIAPVNWVWEILFFLFITAAFVWYFYQHLDKILKPLNVLFKEVDRKGETEQEDREIPEPSNPSVAIERLQDQFRNLNAKNEKLQKLLIDFKGKKKIISQIIENLPIGFVVSSLVDKKILITNKELAEIYGFRPGYLDEINSYHLFPQEEEIAKERGFPEDVFPADILMPQEKKGQIIFNRNGQYQTVDLKRIPIKKEGLLVTLITNVSELTGKEEELAARERLSQFIFDTAEVGLSLVDQFGCFSKVNKNFCSIYGYTEDELLGRHFSLLIPPEKRDHFKKIYKRKMDKMSSQSSPLEEIKSIKKNGEVLDVLTTSRTVFDHHFKGTIYSVLDVTEIRTNQGKFQAAVEGGKLGTWNVNFESGYIEINHHWAEMLGYKKREVIPNLDFFHSLIHPDDQPDFIKEVEKIKSGKQNAFHREVRLRCKNGRYKWILDSGKVLKKNSKGEPVLMAGSHVDIDEVKKAQLEILTHSERLRRAQEMGMVGDWELEVESGTFTCSSMIFRIFGRKRESDFIYEDFLNLFDLPEAGLIRKKIHQAIELQTVFSHEGRIFWKDGTVKYIKLLAVPILGTNGKVVKISGILQDVTSIKTTIETLEKTSQRLQVLSDNVPGGLIQFKVSEFFSPQIMYLSRGAEKIWGVSRDQVLEGDVSNLFKNIHPLDHNVIRRSLIVASKRLQKVGITWRTLLESGETRWHHGIGIPSKNKDNSITWNALILDITEQKVSENKIREQEEYMQVLTQHASDAIIACDQSGKIRFVNDTFRKWMEPLEIIIKTDQWPLEVHFYSIEHDRPLKASEFSLLKALEEGRVVNQEFLIKNPGKQVRYVQSNGAALYDSSGDKIGAMVVLRDITERVQKDMEVSNAIIKAREKERSKIAAEIHDGITQSLSVVAMNMKNLKFDYKELEDSEKYTKALDYLQGVIEQSRTLAHKIMPNSIQDFGLVEAVQELVEQCSFGSKENISFEYTGYGRTSSSKELHIFRVIQEGLGNALKHSGAQNIQIKLNFGTDHIRVSIKDDGSGFNAEKSYLQHGIGLLSMRDRVKKVKGRFRIFSGSKGTIVWLKVPVIKNMEENEKT